MQGRRSHARLAAVMESRSEYISVRGLRYHLRRWGSPGAPTVYLLHGWLDTSATWHDVGAALAARWQVVCPDWRGLGLSEWPQDGYWFQDYVADLDAILERCAPGEAVDLVGHSMGGQAASLYAGLRPARVRRLVLLDALFLPDMEPALAPRRFREWLDELRDPPQAKSYASFDALAQRVRKQHPQLSEERALFVARGWGRTRDDGRIELCADPKHRLRGPGLYRSAEALAIWREVTASTLFVDGGRSPLIQALPAEELRRRRECFRQRRETVIGNAGHMLHFDAPAETARAIAAFLDAPLPQPQAVS